MCIDASDLLISLKHRRTYAAKKPCLAMMDLSVRCSLSTWKGYNWVKRCLFFNKKVATFLHRSAHYVQLSGTIEIIQWVLDWDDEVAWCGCLHGASLCTYRGLRSIKANKSTMNWILVQEDGVSPNAVSSFACSNPFVFCSLNFTTKQKFVSNKTTSGPNGYWICSKSMI
jgi:hypothetical protein